MKEFIVTLKTGSQVEVSVDIAKIGNSPQFDVHIIRIVDPHTKEYVKTIREDREHIRTVIIDMVWNMIRHGINVYTLGIVRHI